MNIITTILKNRLTYLLIIFAVSNFLLFASEYREEVNRRDTLKKLSLDIDKVCAFFVGYENNVWLDSSRKGDVFQEIFLNLKLKKQLPSDTSFIFRYNIDYLNYSEFTKFSNLINFLHMGFSKYIGDFVPYVGYEFVYQYYPRENELDSLFNKVLIKFTHNITSAFSHFILLEAGVKKYPSSKALGEDIFTYQSSPRREYRYSASYNICTKWAKNILEAGFKFSYNDSNDVYQDFYDYYKYNFRVIYTYLLNLRTNIWSKFEYSAKKYTNRTPIFRDYLQKDHTYIVDLGLDYKLTKYLNFIVDYQYVQVSSNEPLQEYSESIILCGCSWRF